MKANPLDQVWSAVYKKNGDGSSRVVALFESEEDAQYYHANPALYAVLNRKVRLMPAPIIVASPSPLYTDLAFAYCQRMADPAFPDSEIGDFFDELKSFVAKYEEASAAKSSPTTNETTAP
jgi:hypothetical protein